MSFVSVSFFRLVLELFVRDLGCRDVSPSEPSDEPADVLGVDAEGGALPYQGGIAEGVGGTLAQVFSASRTFMSAILALRGGF